jgi:hypothetical protein
VSPALQLSLDIPADTESLHSETAMLEVMKKEKKRKTL